MTDEIELFGDGADLVVVGNPNSVDRFLKQANLLEASTDIPLGKLKTVLNLGGEGAKTVAAIGEQSGRYLKLTPESDKQLKAAGGLMAAKEDGVSYAMLGDPGRVSKWLQVEDGPGALLTNPAVLAGVGGLMTQLSQQAEANELKALLLRIDEQLDDVRRAQRDAVLAKMDRAMGAIDEAIIIRNAGGDPETLWSKVNSEAATILEVQASALRALDALADKVDGKSKARELKKAAAEIEKEVAVWLAVLARCFELQDEFKVLEIDHVLATAPENLAGHRRGVTAATRKRRTRVLEKTSRLMDRMDAAGGVANGNVLLHARAAHAVIHSLNSTAALVDDFHAPLGIERDRQTLMSPRWREALRDPQQLKTAGVEVGQKAAMVGGTAVAAVATLAAAKNSNKSGT